MILGFAIDVEIRDTVSLSIDRSGKWIIGTADRLEPIAAIGGCCSYICVTRGVLVEIGDDDELTVQVLADLVEVVPVRDFDRLVGCQGDTARPGESEESHTDDRDRERDPQTGRGSRRTPDRRATPGTNSGQQSSCPAQVRADVPGES